MRSARFALAFAVGGIVVVSSARASAVQTELLASVGVEAPARSDYRTAAQALGYALDYPRIAYEGELGARFAVACDRKLWIAPLVRLHVDRLGAPYDGLDPIYAESAVVAAREEYLFARFPPLFLWMDESFGFARVGRSGAYGSATTWGLRGGVGVRIGWPHDALRIRVGWSWAPTIGNVSPAAGGYDFGGLVVAIDGVLRVVDE